VLFSDHRMTEGLTAGGRQGIDRRSMRQASPSSLKPVRIAESLLIGALGGFLFDAARFPAGWLAGSMVFAAVAGLAGRPIHVPSPLARACSIALGITIGGAVMPETLRGMITWPLSIAMVSISVAAATLATYTYLTRVHGWNRLTAIFASTPGGLAQVMALAAEEGRDCDIRGVAIVQTLRVLILTVVVPATLSLTGLAEAVRLPASPIAAAEAPVGFAILIVTASAAALGLLRLGIPGGLMFGPLVVSAVLHGGAFITVTMPSWLANAAMVVLGTVSGGRFTGMPFRLLLGYLGAALGAFAVSLVVTAAIGISVTLMVPIPISDLVVAYAPGAVDAMMILALALHLDPVFVGAHHLTRVLVVSLGLPILAHYYSGPGTRRTKRSRPILPKGDGLDD
jgi:membrane AbrB-like protein